MDSKLCTSCSANILKSLEPGQTDKTDRQTNRHTTATLSHMHRGLNIPDLLSYSSLSLFSLSFFSISLTLSISLILPASRTLSPSDHLQHSMAGPTTFDLHCTSVSSHGCPGLFVGSYV